MCKSELKGTLCHTACCVCVCVYTYVCQSFVNLHVSGKHAQTQKLSTESSLQLLNFVFQVLSYILTTPLLL